MAVDGVKVIGAWPSPFVMRPRIALNIKGVTYEFLEETLGKKSEILLKSNPVYKKMPVLLHNERPICESMVIVEYIDHVWKNSSAPALLPADPYELALAKFWAYYVDDKWFPSLMAVAKAQTEEEKTKCFEQVQANTDLLEGAFEKCSKGKNFFGGDSVGFLDVALGSFLGWIRATEKMNDGLKIIGVESTPHLSQWAERFCNEESVKGVMPETDKLVEFTKVLQAMWKNTTPK